MKNEYKYQRKESLNLARKIASGNFEQKDGTMIYNSRWQSQISFYLPITTFSYTQCCRLQKPIYSALLPILGYNRHLPLAVRHGPKAFGGAGMLHMYTEQGTKHLKHTLSLLKQTSDLPKQLRITLSNYQMLIGTRTLFLNLDMKLFPYCVKGKGCIAFLWKFSNENNISYNIPGIWRPPPSKNNNYNIMEYFTSVPNIAKIILFQLESCRLYLQVNNLS